MTPPVPASPAITPLPIPRRDAPRFEFDAPLANDCGRVYLVKDAAPTEGSGNFVDSGAVYKAVASQSTDVESLRKDLAKEVGRATAAEDVLARANATTAKAVEKKADKTELANYVPAERTVNGKPLAADVTLTAEDVGALADDGGDIDLGNERSLKGAVEVEAESVTATGCVKANTLSSDTLLNVSAEGDVTVTADGGEGDLVVVGGISTGKAVNAGSVAAQSGEFAKLTFGAGKTSVEDEFASDARGIAENAEAISENAAALATHKADKANPHAVTAAQVGAYTTAETDAKIAACAERTDGVNMVQSSSSSGAAFYLRLDDIYYDAKGMSPTRIDLTVFMAGASARIHSDDAASELPTDWTLLMTGTNGSVYYKVQDNPVKVVCLSMDADGGNYVGYDFAGGTGWNAHGCSVGATRRVVDFAEEALSLGGKRAADFASASGLAALQAALAALQAQVTNLAARAAALDPDTSTISDTIKALKGN